MSNKDVARASSNSKRNKIQHEIDSLLTPEQHAFADVVGREIARFWRETRQEGLPGYPRVPKDSPGGFDVAECDTCPGGIAP